MKTKVQVIAQNLNSYLIVKKLKRKAVHLLMIVITLILVVKIASHIKIVTLIIIKERE